MPKQPAAETSTTISPGGRKRGKQTINMLKPFLNMTTQQVRGVRGNNKSRTHDRPCTPPAEQDHTQHTTTMWARLMQTLLIKHIIYVW